MVTSPTKFGQSIARWLHLDMKAEIMLVKDAARDLADGASIDPDLTHVFDDEIGLQEVLEGCSSPSERITVVQQDGSALADLQNAFEGTDLPGEVSVGVDTARIVAAPRRSYRDLQEVCMGSALALVP